MCCVVLGSAPGQRPRSQGSILNLYILFVRTSHLLGSPSRENQTLAEDLYQLYRNVFIPCGCVVGGVLTENKCLLLELLLVHACEAVAYFFRWVAAATQ